MSSQNFELTHFEMLNLWPLKFCKISQGLYGDSHVEGQLMSSSPFCRTMRQENRQTSEAYISKTFDLNDIKFGRVVKMQFPIKFQKFGPLALNLYHTVLHDII